MTTWRHGTRHGEVSSGAGNEMGKMWGSGATGGLVRIAGQETILKLRRISVYCCERPPVTVGTRDYSIATPPRHSPIPITTKRRLVVSSLFVTDDVHTEVM